VDIPKCLHVGCQLVIKFLFQSPLAHLRDVYLKWAAAYPPSTDLHCLSVIPLDPGTPGYKLKYSSNSIEKVAL
jgi:hypothetical protein